MSIATVLLICATIVAPCVYSSSIPQVVETNNVSSARDSLIHPKDRKPGPGPRIIGGEEVEPHSYPSQVGLFIYASDATYFCGGSLISNQWVLTAAHCVDMNPKFILVELGVHDLNDLSEVTVLNATKYKHHPDWNANKLINDVGLIRLPKNVTFSTNIKPVVIASGSNKYEGVNGTTLGWGETSTVSLSNVLNSVVSEIMTNDDCKAASTAFEQVVVSSHICTSGSGTKGVCSGDSGGPLLVDGVQVGIVSFGATNCELGLPSAYTRLTDFHDWIVANAKDGAEKRVGSHFAAIVSLVLSVVYFFK